MRFDLEGKVAVVTGVGGRLGPVWAEALLTAGAAVVGSDLAAPPASRRLAELRRKHVDRLLLHDADVRERDSLEKLREVCNEAFGAADIVVNNAGVDQPPSADARGTDLHDVPFEAIQRVLDVNLIGAFQVAQVFGRDMVEHRRGSIINIGSLYASVSPDARFYDHLPMDPPFLKPPAYGASKAALINLTRYLAAHWGGSGVRVNALSPGGVLGEQDDEFQRKFTARVPLRRMATSDDLQGPLLFLASDSSAYVTGIELRVDGGFTAW